MAAALTLLRRSLSGVTMVALSAGAMMLGGCNPFRKGHAWSVADYSNNQALFKASLQEFNRKHWENAQAGFEQLSLNLPARDSLLPLAIWYLARTHERQGDHLLAAQSFTRLTETFPDDTLADDALMMAGRNYSAMWRKPELDPEYGESALNTYKTLMAMYPNSSLRDGAQKEIDRLTSWFAQKEYENGMFYFRRKGYDSANIYFKDLLRLYPTAPQVKDAELRLVQSYRAIKYREDAAEMCDQLQKSYPRDREVVQLCGAPPPVAQTTPAPSPKPIP